MARKGWDDLSSSYRARLERGGIDRTAYQRGDSLSSARGHLSRADLIKEVQKLKSEINGDKPTFNKRNSDKSVTHNPGTGKPRTVKSLKTLQKVLSEKLKEIKKGGSEDYDWDYYGNELEDYDLEGLYYQ